ncbi:hypothetical protein RchiOBHm_Chr1g0379961 [Rosa chinensis]|uniref:UBA domain-containing protein n=1 Tax=Rosa chinensis TaxID=74649 RepID=A0A2P6SNS6_ROSCH|nr:uncharacterized protein LOC112182524 isoform X2 [Rosa chinensis]PRQ60327.1 hypothetical protein RchiOBHm_Chr1g0379961 [Rosa chinensis]
MDYDYRKTSSYGAQIPPYRPASSSQPMYGPPQPSSSLYPRVGQQHGQAPVPTPSHGGGGHRPVPHHQTATTSAPSSSAGLGIRVMIKPEYRITPPPQLLTQVGDIPRSNFQFDFDFERKVLAEAQKETPNWGKLGLENLPPPKAVEPPSSASSSSGSIGNPVVRKYVTSGLSQDVVPRAVATYGDNPEKVREFVHGFNALHEMGFPSDSVADALLMYDNDKEKALAYLINSSS